MWPEYLKCVLSACCTAVPSECASATDVVSMIESMLVYVDEQSENTVSLSGACSILLFG